MSDLPQPRGNRPLRSPFDAIRHEDIDPDRGVFEYWSAREMMAPLDYQRWESFQEAIDRAVISCRMAGFTPADHFREVTKMVNLGSGASRTVRDIQLSRRGCYWVAMNGDPRKRPVALAQAYFTELVMRAERASPPPAAAPLIRASQLEARPWYDRVRETWMPHIQFMNRELPESFTVASEVPLYIIQMEDILRLHEVVTRSGDRPDVSIGARWARYRRETLGYPEVAAVAPLYLPDQNITVPLKVYPESERNAFRRWLRDVYLRDNYLAYVDSKKEWKEAVPAVTKASVAEHTCVSITGRSANLPEPRRAVLPASGDRVPVSQAGRGLPSGPERPALPES